MTESKVPEYFGLYEYLGQDRYQLLDVPGQPTPRSSEQMSDSPCAPVVLYVHGWQRGTVKVGIPDQFVTSLEIYGEERDVGAPWLMAGYRVLCFMWIPFADEDDLATAEQKIWAGPEKGSAGQRWRQMNGSFDELPGICDIGSAFFQVFSRSPIVRAAPYLRLVGHSLGCQLSSRLVQLILEARALSEPPQAELVLPQRFALLDPYFTNFGKSYLNGRWTGELVREIVRAAGEAGCVVEHVRSSNVLANPLSDTNEKLQAYAATFDLRPEFLKLAYGPRDVEVLQNRHAYARFAYFASFSTPEAKRAEDGQKVSGLAGLADSDIGHLVTAGQLWVQDAKLDSWAPEELTFSPQPLPRVAQAEIRSRVEVTTGA